MKICGMDEVGRGAFAGPLVACAAVFNKQCTVNNLRDSKKLTKKLREKIYKELMKNNIEYVVEEIGVDEINEFGIGWANREIFKRLKNKIMADKYIADGNLKIEGIISEIRADNKYPAVMAASIIAKVTRDGYMNKLHEEYIIYGWNKNVGYGTKKHIEALRLNGTTRFHRVKFVETALNKSRRD